MDSFGLELDGVELLPGASEEPLGKVMEELTRAVRGLLAGRAFAQVSLSEAHLELVLTRYEDAVDVRVVSLARPAKVARLAGRIDLTELQESAVRVGRRWLAELERDGRENGRPRRVAVGRLGKELAALERAHVPEHQRRILTGPGEPAPGFSFQCLPGPFAFGLEVSDPEDLLARYNKGEGAVLAPVLSGGKVSLRLGTRTLQAVSCSPFLFALELARQGAELAHHIDTDELNYRFTPGGVLPELLFDLRTGELEHGMEVELVEPRSLARAMFGLGLEFVLACTTHNRALTHNPYLQGLSERCREGLSALRSALPEQHGEARAKRRRGNAAARPLPTAGRVKRLRFEPRWTQTGLGKDDEPGKLVLGPKGPLVTSGESAQLMDEDGTRVLERRGTHGVAVLPDGTGLLATERQVVGFRGMETGARWARDFEGIPLGPELLAMDGLYLTVSEQRTVLAFDLRTGRDVWRISPPRAQRVYVSLQAHRAVVTTDSGYLYGLDLKTGLVRYRVRTALPFLGAVRTWGRRTLAVLGRGERAAILATDAHTGEASWVAELQLARPSLPLPHARRVYVAGLTGETPTLMALNEKGVTVWEQPLPLGLGPFSVMALGAAVLVTDATGAAVRISPRGEVEWALGPAGEELACAPSPQLSRGVLLIPGETVRAVEPRTGQVLAQVRGGPGLCALAADAKLNLYLLEENGTLTAHRLTTHLAVVDAPSGARTS